MTREIDDAHWLLRRIHVNFVRDGKPTASAFKRSPEPKRARPDERPHVSVNWAECAPGCELVARLMEDARQGPENYRVARLTAGSARSTHASVTVEHCPMQGLLRMNDCHAGIFFEPGGTQAELNLQLDLARRATIMPLDAP